MDWTRNYTAEYRVYRVDRRTWADAGRVGGVVSASVVRSANGNAPMLESGTFAYDGAPGEEVGEDYHRVVMIAEQGGERERIDVCTMLCRSIGTDAQRGYAEHNIEGSSVLYPASRRRLLVGTYAPQGSDGAAYVGDLLAECIHAPVEVTGGFTLDSHVVFDAGSTALAAAWLVLKAGGYVMRVTGDGVVHVVPRPTAPALVIDRDGQGHVSDGISADYGTAGMPNRYTAVDGAQSATAVNDDAGSGISVAVRGYYDDVYDSKPVRVGGETLAAYAARKLAEASVADDTRAYTREYRPDVLPFDVVRAMLPSRGMEGDYRVKSQSLSIGRGITVNETASREVALWTA